ncbi:MAG: hypothetical protein FD144_3211 [Rhodospirillaceae bacterium]|nr:MAG: hypothetical protein FD144_3211 [Rhodospirillaceae bacterium]
MAEIAEAPVHTVRLAGGLLGVALGGFFDGILLHQILQWHHLLSAIDPANARMQVMADGLFHLLMYLLALVGLWQLWRVARRARVPTAPLVVALLAGFGAWHLVDAVMSHWLLGIHRIRMDTPSPLLWDLLWLAGFGIGPLVAAIWISRTPRAPGGGASSATLGLIAVLVAGAGYQTLQSPADGEFTTILLLPGSTSSTLFSTAASVDARVAWTDASGLLAVLAHPPGERASLRLLAHGALALDSAFLPAGCFSWLRS